MLHLHIPTLLFGAAVVNVTLTCFCLGSWFGRRDREIYKWLGLTGGMASIGFLVLLTHSKELPVECVWIAQACFQLAAGMAWSGVRVFEGRKTLPLVMWAGPSLWCAAYFVPGVIDSFITRVIFSSSVICTYYGAITLELLRGYRLEPLKSRSMAIAISVVHIIFVFGRVGLALTVDVRNWQLAEGSNRIGVFVIEALIIMILLVLTLTNMERDRVEIEQRKMASTDVLTGAMSRRAFLDTARSWVEAHGKDAALILFDLDHFKRINDTYGHAAGDVALVTFSNLVKERLKAANMIAGFNLDASIASHYPRWYETAMADAASEGGNPLFGRLGGEEFACLLPHLSQTQSLAIAEDIRKNLSELDISVGATTMRMSVSAAVVTTADIGHHLDEMFAAADEALYRAKHAGRNRVESGQAVVNMAIRKFA